MTSKSRKISGFFPEASKSVPMPTEEEIEDYFDAAIVGDFTRIKKFIWTFGASQVDVGCRNQLLFDTALQAALFRVALIKKDLEIVDFLLTQGADIYQHNKKRLPPALSCSIIDGPLGVDALNLMIEKCRFDINHMFPDCENKTLLYYAIKVKNFPITKHLLSLGANIGTSENGGDIYDLAKEAGEEFTQLLRNEKESRQKKLDALIENGTEKSVPAISPPAFRTKKPAP